MSVNLKAVLNSSAIDATSSNPSQRQLVIQASATPATPRRQGEKHGSQGADVEVRGFGHSGI